MKTKNSTKLAINRPRASRLLTLIAGALFTVESPAAFVTLDGILADLIAAQSFTNNVAWATDPNNDGESNGFDITAGYLYYELGTDTMFLGMSMFGQVGTAGGMEGAPTRPNSAAGVFDQWETYGFDIDIDTDAVLELSFRLSGDNIANSGTETVATLFNPSGLTVDWIVSEANNGVEFSIKGLLPLLLPFTSADPRDVTATFYAGSITNLGAEDMLAVNAQIVPLPAAGLLFGAGIAGLTLVGRRKRNIA